MILAIVIIRLLMILVVMITIMMMATTIPPKSPKRPEVTKERGRVRDSKARVDIGAS